MSFPVLSIPFGQLAFRAACPWTWKRLLVSSLGGTMQQKTQLLNCTFGTCGHCTASNSVGLPGSTTGPLQSCGEGKHVRPNVVQQRKELGTFSVCSEFRSTK